MLVLALVQVWTTVLTPDSALQLRVPASYRQQSGYACWDNHGATSQHRDFCAGLDSSSHVSQLHLTNTPTKCAADCMTYEKSRVDTMQIGGRPAYVERALVSGGIQGWQSQRVVLVIVPFPDGRSAVIQGHLGDDAGYAEIVAIARTIKRIR